MICNIPQWVDKTGGDEAQSFRRSTFGLHLNNNPVNPAQIAVL